MSKKVHELPPDLLDDERTWQGDHDPYLAMLAHAGREQDLPEPPPARSPSLDDTLDGDVYLAQLARNRDRDSEADPDKP